MKGRKPFPFEIVEATNDKVRKTKSDLDARKENQPAVDSACLICPSHLSEGAKKEWHRIVKLYRQLDHPIITDLDTQTMEIYCEAVARWHKAMKKVLETSEVFTQKGEKVPRKNPWLRVADEAAEQIHKSGEVLLLTPVSRARAALSQNKRDQGDPFEKFMTSRKSGYES